MIETMIDIETLGTGPRSIVLSIGAVNFSDQGPLDQGIFLPLDIDQQIAMGCDGTQSTLLWWMEQSEEARRKSFCKDRLHLPDAYGHLKRYVADVQQFWAKGPQFDMVTLENVFKGAPPLWKYNTVRDMRTLQSECGLDGWAPPRWEGVAHDPCSDCMFQIHVVLEARRRMRQGLELSEARDLLNAR